MSLLDPDPPRASLRTRLDRLLLRAQRAVLRRRRLLAALLAAAAVWTGLGAVASPSLATVPVLVAARDLPAGTILAATDLVEVGFRPGTAPVGAVRSEVAVTGRSLAAPMTKGEPITLVRLVGADLAAALSGRRAVPVRLPDPGMVALLEVGDQVDLIAASPKDGSVSTVAVGVPVLALPDLDAEVGVTASGLPGRLVILGLTPTEIAPVTSATLSEFLTYTWSER